MERRFDDVPERNYEEIDWLRTTGLHVNWWPGALEYTDAWRVLRARESSTDESEYSASSGQRSNGEESTFDRSLFLGKCSFGWAVDLGDFMGPGRCRYFEELESAVRFIRELMFDGLDPVWEPRRRAE